MVLATNLKPTFPTAASHKAAARDILVGIDGTGSKKWLTKDRSHSKSARTVSRFWNGQTVSNSHVYCFVHDAATPTDQKLYLHGPDDLGFTVKSIAVAGIDFITNQLQKAIVARQDQVSRGSTTLGALGIRVSLVGHSRGGLIAILIAKRLREYKLHANIPLLHVHFLGLFDAVDRHLGPGADVIPGNVIAAYHALRDPTVESRSWFGNTGTKAEAPCRYTPKVFTATHSGVGGDPWGGDRPKQITEDMDVLGSDSVGTWMEQMAKMESIPFAKTKRVRSA